MAHCPVCDSSQLRDVLDLEDVTVFCNQLCQSREQALSAARGDIALRFCETCGHTFNAAFEPERVRYSPEYENTLHCSGQFQEYASELTEELSQRYGLRGTTVVELGCGDGRFLTDLCNHAEAHGVGFDPSYPGEPGAVNERVEIHRCAWDDAALTLAPALVCCRHCLEHVPEPCSFVRSVHQRCPAGTPVFFEVPNALFTMRDGGIWDILYEHCGYFSAPSLQATFESTGHAVGHVSEAFGGQFLVLEGASGAGPSPRRGSRPPEPDSLLAHVEHFAAHYAEKTARFRSLLQDAASAGTTVAVWGAGTKGVMFLNTVGTGVEVAVDINPKKHGKFVAGTGQPIVSPAELIARKPGLVIVMNPAYAQEVTRTLAQLDLRPQVVVA